MSVMLGGIMQGQRGGASGAVNPNIFNGVAPLPNWQKALAARLAGTRNARLCLFGDSSPLGYGSNSTANQQALWAGDALIAQALGAYNIPAGYQTAIGGKGFTLTAASLANWDSRASQGTFTYTDFNATDFYSYGGEFLERNGSAGTYSFTPANQKGVLVAWDTCIIYYATFPGGGTFNKQAGSGATTAVNTNAANGLATTTLTQTLGTGAAKAVWFSGDVYVLGFECYNSAAKEVTCINCGWSGSLAQSWASVQYPWNCASALSVMKPDIALVGMMANDVMTGGRTIAQAQADCDTFLAALKAANCDIILYGYPPVDTTQFSQAGQDSVNNAFLALATKYNCPFINANKMMSAGFIKNNAAGLMNDPLHRGPQPLAWAAQQAVTLLVR